MLGEPTQVSFIYADFSDAYGTTGHIFHVWNGGDYPGRLCHYW